MSKNIRIAQIWTGERFVVIFIAALMAAAVSIVGIALATLQVRVFGLTRSTWITLAFGLSMKHTGLALVLAGSFLQDQPRVILVVLLTTLAQHIAAGAIDLYIQHARK